MSVIEIQPFADSIAPVLLGMLLRSSALVIAGGFALFLIRSRSAELRHFLCHGMLYGLLVLPLVKWGAPPIQQASIAVTRAELAVFPDQPTIAVTATKPGIPNTAAIRNHVRRLRWLSLAAVVYIFVASTLVLRLVLNLSRLRRLVHRSDPVLDRDAGELLHEIWLQSLSDRKPRIRVSTEVRVPMAAGMEEVSILLPEGWEVWSRDKLRAALIHEMAHVRRRDPQTAFLASVVVCLFWLNPFVYWLRKQLLALAEEACDETALFEFSPEEYAGFLIEFASNVGVGGGRLVAASTVAARRAKIRKRLENIFSKRHKLGRTSPLARAALMTALIPALYLAVSARFEQQQFATGRDQTSTISIANQSQADELEAHLLRDPENLTIRAALMVYYANERNESAFIPHLLWVINHHPEVPAAMLQVYRLPDLSPYSLQDSRAAHGSAEPDHELIKTAWERALDEYPESPDVLSHAGLFIESSDPKRALDLFDRAAELASVDSPSRADYLHQQAVIYAAAVMADPSAGDPRFRLNDIAMDQRLASELRAKMETSGNPALFCQAGTILVQLGQDREGLAFIERAIHLDPENPKWKEAMESAKAEPIRRQNLHKLMDGETDHTVRIGAGVAEANLITKVQPTYPPRALEDHISGTVEFVVSVGVDGRVTSLELVHGNPLLVNAAKDAVIQWIYRPTLLNGKPVPITTTVKVPFNLPEK